MIIEWRETDGQVQVDSKRKVQQQQEWLSSLVPEAHALPLSLSLLQLKR